MTRPFSFAVQANRGYCCDAPRCSLPRHGISLYCAAHNDRARRYGDPHGSPLASSLWTEQRTQVADLLQKNASHRGQLQALAFITGLLTRAAADERSFPGAEEFARLGRHGVSAVMILAELAAVSLYLHGSSRAVRTDKAHDFAVSAAVMKLAPRPRRVVRKPGTPWGVTVQPTKPMTYSPKARSTALAFIGSHLRQTLGGFIANVQLAVETRDAQQQAWDAELCAPLTAI